jgi:hypothetical protein
MKTFKQVKIDDHNDKYDESRRQEADMPSLWKTNATDII